MSSDPVAAAGRLIVAINAARAALEDQILALDKADTFTRARLSQEDDYLFDYLRATEESVTHQQAASLEGAMLQVMLAMGEADAMHSFVPDRSCDRHLRRIERCLYSVINALARISGTDPAAVGGRYYASEDRNPLAKMLTLAA